MCIRDSYNTYRIKGLPPGPICTPAAKTIDLVLDAPKTDYIYFVAKADFSGCHHFSNNYAEHDRYAKEYQKKLDEYQAKKAMDNNSDRNWSWWKLKFDELNYK